MANQAAKRIVQQNQRYVRNLLIIFALTLGKAVAHALNLCAMSAMLWLLRAIARPRIVDGDIVDPGHDLSITGGLSDYYYDVFYVSAFVQFTTTVLSDWFWLTYVPVAMFAAYKVWTGIISPLFLSGGAGPDDSDTPVGRNRRERREMERNAKKGAASGHH
eukprot:m51a1_g3490 putative transmembrane protein 208-like (161) ;mRNA; r:794712-795580